MLPDSAAIEPLLAERDALKGWLVRLDQAGSSTPEAVRAKVRVDYEHRLESITDRLRAHADTIAARLAEDQTEHAEFVEQLTMAQAMLAEAELRHAVGEYDARRFEDEQSRLGDEITRWRQGLDAAAERIERMEAVHLLVTQPPVVSVESLAPALMLTPTPTPVEVAPVPRPVNEARFEDALLSVFDEPKDRGEPSPGLSPLSFRPGSGMPAEAPRPSEPRRFSPSSETPPLGVPQDSLPRFSRQPDAPAPSTPTTAERATPPAGSAASADDALFGGDTIVAAGADVSLPASRTLRCGECGAMNKPLEWYCEKCGAELTAA